jgi:hypothetical protein
MSRLPLSLDRPFTQHLHEGVLYILLPEMSALIDDQALFRKTSAYLRSALGMIPSLFV